MYNKRTGSTEYRGIFTRLKALFERNRLGELLVLKGLLTTKELKYALASQKAEKAHLGRILIDKKLVSRSSLYKTLAEQWTLRGLTWAMGLFLTFASLGVKNARAGTIKDVPAQLQLASTANAAFTTMHTYPALFGAEEQRSSDLSAFTKWTGMFVRFERALSEPQNRNMIRNWQNDIRAYEGLSLEKMAHEVNTYINEQDYIVDIRNWGKSDYWSTPVEFFARGGDCEDFAIAKYASLRALGVPEDRMRVAIVHDLQKDIPHAVLIVYTDTGAMILDNQNDRAEKAQNVSRYRPIFSINRQAWWLHTKPSTTQVASVN